MDYKAKTFDVATGDLQFTPVGPDVGCALATSMGHMFMPHGYALLPWRITSVIVGGDIFFRRAVLRDFSQTWTGRFWTRAGRDDEKARDSQDGRKGLSFRDGRKGLSFRSLYAGSRRSSSPQP